MANIKSQIKRNRQNDKKRLRNRVYRGEARIAVKNARTDIDAGLQESKAALMQAISTLDKAAEQGVIHKNNAARRKSRLVKAFAKMVPPEVKAPVQGEPTLETEPSKIKVASRRSSARKVEEPKAELIAEGKEAPSKEKKTTSRKSSSAASSKTKKADGKKPAAKSNTKKKAAAAKES